MISQPIQTSKPPAPTVSRFTVRSWQSDADYDEMSRVLIASRAADGLEEARTGDDLRRMYARTKNFDATRNLFLVEHAGQVIAYAGGRWWQEADANFSHAHWFMVLPEWRGQGIENELLSRVQAQVIRDVLPLHPGGATSWFETFVADSQSWLGNHLSADGYAPVRYFYDMVCADLNNLPEAELPPGIETRPVAPGHLRQIWDAACEAFAEHWGEAIPDESDYQSWLENPIWRFELWQIAWDGDQVVGMVLNHIKENENNQCNRKRGYTEDISVRKSWRGRGVAKSLLVRSMKMFRDMGFDSTALGVDSENATGALHLYESVGYKTFRRVAVYRKRIA